MQTEDTAQKRRRPIPVIGLTGGIACGKSTVLAHLRGLGALSLNADTLYRELVQPGQPLLVKIADEFGVRALTPDGALDRAYIAQRVFNDKPALEKLNMITHPAILQELMRRLEAASGEGFKWAVFEAAILVEGDSYKEVDFLVVISAPEAIRAERVITRDGLSPDEAQTRIAAQVPLSAYESKADYILRNSGNREALEDASQTLFKSLVARFGPPS